ncbi:protein YLS3-like [Canna indica]|uniref:Protein YLS3-like n=1 Tax=Canna indica TaxID=4628 RepID=A0AAQ3KHF9_9LILI|nr:protein YLS3-like [Canna indica]
MNFLQAILISLMLAVAARADFASDQAECGSQLLGLATCLTFVQGNANAPTPDCCSAAKGVVAKSFKCLCVLIKDKDEPQLGFKIDVSRAALLPSLCDVSANITDCPRLLGLPSNSADAKVFEQLANDIAHSGGNSTESSNGQSGTKSPKTNEASNNECLGVSNGVGIWTLAFVILHVTLFFN